jgi:hypothetical protein
MNKSQEIDLYECWYASTYETMLEVKCFRWNDKEICEKMKNNKIFKNSRLLAIPRGYNIEEKKDYVRRYMNIDLELNQSEK